MKVQLPFGRIAAIGVAILGTVCCLVSTLASYWSAIGATPPSIYGRVNLVTTLARWKYVPIEYFGLVWFVVVALLYGLSPRGSKVSYSIYVFLSAIPFCGLGMWITWRDDLVCWPILIGTLAGIVILLISATVEAPTLRALPSCFRTDLLLLVRSPVAKMFVSVIALLLVLGCEMFHLRVGNIAAGEASERAFRSWYQSQTRLAMPDMMKPGGIKIVLFTDYQCPACAAAVPQSIATIKQFNQRSKILTELLVKDYPLETECNAAFGEDMHPWACEAAVAVRLVRKKVGEKAARGLGEWLYQNGSRLSTEVVRGRLGQYLLEDDYAREYNTLLSEVASDAAQGQRIGVHGTPTFFVNGVKLLAASLLGQALDYEAKALARTKSMSQANGSIEKR